MSDIVHLNVGGYWYTTYRSTLANSNSFFAGLVSDTEESDFFVDRDGTHFRHILNWMRGVTFLPEDDTILQELVQEADFYSLTSMRESIIRCKQRYSHLRLLNNIYNELRQSSRAGARS